jgi:hypothetical protein
MKPKSVKATKRKVHFVSDLEGDSKILIIPLSGLHTRNNTHHYCTGRVKNLQSKGHT